VLYSNRAPHLIPLHGRPHNANNPATKATNPAPTAASTLGAAPGATDPLGLFSPLPDPPVWPSVGVDDTVCSLPPEMAVVEVVTVVSETEPESEPELEPEFVGSFNTSVVVWPSEPVKVMVVWSVMTGRDAEKVVMSLLAMMAVVVPLVTVAVAVVLVVVRAMVLSLSQLPVLVGAGPTMTVSLKDGCVTVVVAVSVVSEISVPSVGCENMAVSVGETTGMETSWARARATTPRNASSDLCRRADIMDGM